MDPFTHHPELRDQIDDPEGSFLRKLSIGFLEEMSRENDLPSGWWYSDQERETLRKEALGGRMDRDLWVFGYGSLMWDPGIKFAEVRRAKIEGYARKFILLEANGGRGTPDNPGLMAALDKGDCCAGLVFRIERSKLDEETYILWHREQIAPAYLPKFVSAETDLGTVEALTFVADHGCNDIDANISRDDQVRMIATGSGVLGSAADYLRGVVTKLAQLEIEDTETSSLLAAFEEFERSQSQTG